MIGTLESRPDAAADLRAFQIRQPQIEHDQIRGAARRPCFSASRAGAGDIDVVAARAQERPHRALDRDLVVDEQDAGAWRHDDACVYRALGRRSFGRGDGDGELRAAVRSSSPPRSGPRSTASSPRAIHRPMPVPDARALAASPR